MRTHFRWGTAVVVVLGWAASLPAADDKPAAPLDRKALDERLYDNLREVINRGVDLYNGGDFNGSYRLYEGALLGLRPVLDHRPDWQKTIDEGLAQAARNPRLAERARILRKDVLDKIRADLRPAKDNQGAAKKQ